ncbi:related to Nuclear polyadenylated RNA-binding protein NAB2 [Saccharomycodes ludwigii]|uniref:Related to Nuclear polyadenylated RNA-binding protein NAB2 n=1 Tax=Saccharomycodes ludwigii TaxID=36035 RepID=A0A376BBE6_9ASCO|nr:hypothetical protein SCDLUD_001001 [Saccharomycodes ludwigii]KAH3903372.1 hypothetical protein SCDLUD_001001 [Saccharomycodes ludwigii]SSD61470.1 related to Nuclear polyadenylated RNA-binding protein NAB2 [Saccharomycodes ludwigii]
MSAINESISEQLKHFVAECLTGLKNFSEDRTYVAEYIILLMSNGGSLEDVVKELHSLFDTVDVADLQVVIEGAFVAASTLNSNTGNSSSTLNELLQQVLVKLRGYESQPKTQQVEQVPPPTPSTVDAITQDYNNNRVPIQTSNNKANRASGYGVGKRFVQHNNGGNNRYDVKNKLNNPRYMKNFVKNLTPQKEERCKDFPNCPLTTRECPFAHPTKLCLLYPNCPRKNHTCTFLHPDEDQELMEQLKKSKAEFLEKKNAAIAANIERSKMLSSGIVLCKFGAVCANPKCPFGHPTPCNEDQKVSDYTWCSENLKCVDPNCVKAHSSPSKVKAVQPLGRAAIVTATAANSFATEKSLEQCKYGLYCTNKHCKFRHAKSPIMCRDGSSCTRIDCIFGHPIPEDCKFGVNCTNKACLFRHPEGRVISDSKWVNPELQKGQGQEVQPQIEESQQQQQQQQQQQVDAVMTE